MLIRQGGRCMIQGKGIGEKGMCELPPCMFKGENKKGDGRSSAFAMCPAHNK